MDTGATGGVLAVGLGFFILYVALSGLIVGALARWALPGPDPMGWLPTIGYGLGGSFLGGIAGRLGHLPTRADLIASVACAALLIWFFRRRQRAARPSQDRPK